MHGRICGPIPGRRPPRRPRPTTACSDPPRRSRRDRDPPWRRHVTTAGQVEVLILRLDPALPLPAPAHPGDAGVDLYSADDVEIGPGERAVVSTGIAIALPDGYAAFVHPRSGLAAKHGVTLVNAPGTIDAGYRGEIKVALLNTDRSAPVRFRRGDRIAQLVVQRVERAVFCEVKSLPGSARGEGGLGSTGGHRDGGP